MRNFVRAGLAGVLALALASSASAEEFAGGHVFVAGRDETGQFARVSEFDADGSHVRDLRPAGEDASGSVGIAFGPDGLYVSSYFRMGGKALVSRVRPDGRWSVHLDESDGVSAGHMTIGPRAELYVASATPPDLAREIDGAVERAPLPDTFLLPTHLSILPSGRRVMSDPGLDRHFVIGDAGVGTAELNTKLHPFGGRGSGGVIEMPDDTIRLLSNSAGVFGIFVVAHPDGRNPITVSHANLQQAADLVLLESGNLLFTSGFGAPLGEITAAGAHVRDTPYAGLTFPQQLVVAPYVFTATVGGVVSDEELTLKKLKARGVRLSVELAGGTVMLGVPDLSGPDDLHDAVGSEFVLRGHVSKRAGDAKRRYVHAMIPGDRADEGRGSVVLEIKGTEDGSGRFVPKKIKGTWHYSRGTTTFAGKVSGKLAK